MEIIGQHKARKNKKHPQKMCACTKRIFLYDAPMAENPAKTPAQAQRKPLNTLLDFWAGAAPLHYSLLLLMLYLTIGTIAQKYIGLYQATHIFFSQIIIWAGPIPLPGLPLILAAIFINLTCKLIYKSPWSIKNSGIIITHIGALLLLLGGLITATLSDEGYIDLAQGQSKAYVSHYHQRMMAITDQQGKTLTAIPFEKLALDKPIAIKNTPLTITPLNKCKNCDIIARTPEASINYQGMAANMALQTAPLRQNDEENLTGVTINIKSPKNESAYVLLENVPQNPRLTIDDKHYEISLRKQQKSLPFKVELLSFARETHPGTELVKSYSSRVRITDGPAVWESTIRMNEPLRYKGYALFQSSFIQGTAGNISVLAVVKNAGRSFPYIAGLTMCFGLIIHLWLRRKRKGPAS